MVDAYSRCVEMGIKERKILRKGGSAYEEIESNNPFTTATEEWLKKEGIINVTKRFRCHFKVGKRLMELVTVLSEAILLLNYEDEGLQFLSKNRILSINNTDWEALTAALRELKETAPPTWVGYQLPYYARCILGLEKEKNESDVDREEGALVPRTPTRSTSKSVNNSLPSPAPTPQKRKMNTDQTLAYKVMKTREDLYDEVCFNELVRQAIGDRTDVIYINPHNLPKTPLKDEKWQDVFEQSLENGTFVTQKDHQKFVAPVNRHENHWVAYAGQRTGDTPWCWRFADSLKGGSPEEYEVMAIARLLACTIPEKEKLVRKKDIPIQEDNHSCGPFALEWILQFIDDRNRLVEEWEKDPFEIRKEHVRKFRKDFIHEADSDKAPPDLTETDAPRTPTRSSRKPVKTTLPAPAPTPVKTRGVADMKLTYLKRFAEAEVYSDENFDSCLGKVAQKHPHVCFLNSRTKVDELENPDTKLKTMKAYRRNFAVKELHRIVVAPVHRPLHWVAYGGIRGDVEGEWSWFFVDSLPAGQAKPKPEEVHRIRTLLDVPPIDIGRIETKAVSMPRQIDGHSCGPFALEWLLRFIEERGVPKGEWWGDPHALRNRHRQLALAVSYPRGIDPSTNSGALDQNGSGGAPRGDPMEGVEPEITATFPGQRLFTEGDGEEGDKDDLDNDGRKRSKKRVRPYSGAETMLGDIMVGANGDKQIKGDERTASVKEGSLSSTLHRPNIHDDADGANVKQRDKRTIDEMEGRVDKGVEKEPSRKKRKQRDDSISSQRQATSATKSTKPVKSTLSATTPTTPAAKEFTPTTPSSSTVSDSTTSTSDNHNPPQVASVTSETNTKKNPSPPTGSTVSNAANPQQSTSPTSQRKPAEHVQLPRTPSPLSSDFPLSSLGDSLDLDRILPIDGTTVDERKGQTSDDVNMDPVVVLGHNDDKGNGESLKSSTGARSKDLEMSRSDSTVSQRQSDGNQKDDSGSNSSIRSSPEEEKRAEEKKGNRGKGQEERNGGTKETNDVEGEEEEEDREEEGDHNDSDRDEDAFDMEGEDEDVEDENSGNANNNSDSDGSKSNESDEDSDDDRGKRRKPHRDVREEIKVPSDAPKKGPGRPKGSKNKAVPRSEGDCDAMKCKCRDSTDLVIRKLLTFPHTCSCQYTCTDQIYKTNHPCDRQRLSKEVKVCGQCHRFTEYPRPNGKGGKVCDKEASEGSIFCEEHKNVPHAGKTPRFVDLCILFLVTC